MRNDDDEDEYDRPRRRKKTSGGVPVWLWVVLGVFGLMAVGVVLVCAGMWVGKKNDREQDLAYVEDKKADLTLAQFRVQRPKTPTTLRVKINLSDYWNCEYRDCKDSHFSFHIDGTRAVYVPAWMSKDLEDSKKLYELTKDAKEHWVTVQVQWIGPTGKPTSAGEQGMAILKLVEDH